MHTHSHVSHKKHGHGSLSRRDLLHRVLGGALGGASVLEMGFFRAAMARAQAPGASDNLFDVEKVADGVINCWRYARRYVSDTQALDGLV